MRMSERCVGGECGVCERWVLSEDEWVMCGRSVSGKWVADSIATFGLQQLFFTNLHYCSQPGVFE